MNEYLKFRNNETVHHNGRVTEIALLSHFQDERTFKSKRVAKRIFQANAFSPIDSPFGSSSHWIGAFFVWYLHVLRCMLHDWTVWWKYTREMPVKTSIIQKLAQNHTKNRCQNTQNTRNTRNGDDCNNSRLKHKWIEPTEKLQWDYLPALWKLKRKTQSCSDYDRTVRDVKSNCYEIVVLVQSPLRVRTMTNRQRTKQKNLFRQGQQQRI